MDTADFAPDFLLTRLCSGVVFVCFFSVPEMHVNHARKSTIGIIAIPYIISSIVFVCSYLFLYFTKFFRNEGIYYILDLLMHDSRFDNVNARG